MKMTSVISTQNLISWTCEGRNRNSDFPLFGAHYLILIDSVGEQALSFLKSLGGEFLAETAYSLDVCERLLLPLARQGKSDAVAGLSEGLAMISVPPISFSCR
jgi:hypothetical protein